VNQACLAEKLEYLILSYNKNNIHRVLKSRTWFRKECLEWFFVHQISVPKMLSIHNVTSVWFQFNKNGPPCVVTWHASANKHASLILISDILTHSFILSLNLEHSAVSYGFTLKVIRYRHKQILSRNMYKKTRGDLANVSRVLSI